MSLLPVLKYFSDFSFSPPVRWALDPTRQDLKLVRLPNANAASASDLLIWPSHKKICGGSTSSTDLALKLTKKLLVNEYLMFYLQVYTAIALELLTAPENSLDTCLLVNVVTKDADPLAAVRALINQEARAPGASVMLQIESIEKRPLAVQTTPGMRLALEKARAGLVDTPLQGAPVVLLVFTGDATNCIGYPCPIDPEALKQARERNPFVVKSAMLGVREVPVTEESILEQFNNNIYMDKENRYLLHTKSRD
ncbi:hypothetical protein FB451DRAFT_1391087 [Mycena latifolia]|nr:hypothetical protein FB451DRAFT_1391087 [Mycena latifolia]